MHGVMLLVHRLQAAAKEDQEHGAQQEAALVNTAKHYGQAAAAELLMQWAVAVVMAAPAQAD